MPIGSVLFAAGRGKRLRPLTDEVPKPALPILDIPLGAWGLQRLRQTRPPVVVNVSHLAGRVEEDLAGEGVEFLSEGPVAYGTGGTLHALKDRIEERVLTWSSDVLSDVDCRALLETHRRVGAKATLVVTAVERGADFRTSGHSITTFIDRRREPDAAGMRFLGIAVYEREALDLLSAERPSGLGETLLPKLVATGDLGFHRHDRYALNVGTIDRYLQASLDVLEGRAPEPPLPVPGRIIDVSGGRAYLGPGASAAEGSLGPGAILLRDAAVSRGARVEDAIVWPGEEVPRGAEVTDGVWIGGRLLNP